MEIINGVNLLEKTGKWQGIFCKQAKHMVYLLHSQTLFVDSLGLDATKQFVLTISSTGRETKPQWVHFLGVLFTVLVLSTPCPISLAHN